MLRKNSVKLACIAACVALMVGCSSQPKNKQIEDADLVKTSYHAADALLGEISHHYKNPNNGKGLNLLPSKPILVASFVNIDNVHRSSTFGRMVAEQIGSAISKKGFKVFEMKLRHNVFIQEQTGELLLSREIREISLQHNAHAVLVGTYAAGKRTVYVNAKLVRANDGVVLASHDYGLPIGPDTKHMLNKRR